VPEACMKSIEAVRNPDSLVHAHCRSIIRKNPVSHKSSTETLIFISVRLTPCNEASDEALEYANLDGTQSRNVVR
jgi:hypothetical protein